MAPPNSFPLRLTFGGVNEGLQRILDYHEQGLNGNALDHFRAQWTTLASIYFFVDEDKSNASYFSQLCIRNTLAKNLDHLYAFTHYAKRSRNPMAMTTEEKNNAVKNNFSKGMEHLKNYCDNGKKIPVFIFNIIFTLATYKKLLASRNKTNAAVRPLLDILKLEGDHDHLIKFYHDYPTHVVKYKEKMKEQQEMDPVVIAFGVGVLRLVLGPVSFILEYYKNMMLRKESSISGDEPYRPNTSKDLDWYHNTIRTYKLTPEIEAQYKFYRDQFTRAIDIVSDIILFHSEKTITKKELENLFKPDPKNKNFLVIQKEIWKELNETIALDDLKSWRSTA